MDEEPIDERIIDGRAVAARVRARVAEQARQFAVEHGRPPGLATLLVGDDPASALYVQLKHRACEEVGIASIDRRLPASVDQDGLMAVVEELVADEAVDGVLVQMPLPEHLDPEPVVLAVPPAKDVDGFHPANVGALALGTPLLPSCTPAGVLTLLDEYGVQLAGADAVVIGRSRVVGMPMALLLLSRDATVTVTHARTRGLAEHVRRADVLVSAAGVPGLVTADMVKPGAVVIDVGTTRTEQGLRGDVEFEAVREVASLITPVPGGVGPITIATLLANTVRAAQLRVAHGDRPVR
jgi:methylenetetrahydrofolate dehydrogenase (NADP+) / methenyltetrahydrofolate cyclohydrolase